MRLWNVSLEPWQMPVQEIVAIRSVGGATNFTRFTDFGSIPDYHQPSILSPSSPAIIRLLLNSSMLDSSSSIFSSLSPFLCRSSSVNRKMLHLLCIGKSHQEDHGDIMRRRAVSLSSNALCWWWRHRQKEIWRSSSNYNSHLSDRELDDRAKSDYNVILHKFVV